MNMKITRNDFLKKGALATTGVGALTFLGTGLVGTQKVKATPSGFSWPWPYIALDPEAARIKGHACYWDGFACSAGAFHAIITALQEHLGAPYTDFPTKMLVFGHGGGAGWGTICGALNGAAAAISLVTDKATSDILVNELIGWYTLEKFPSDISNTYAVDHVFTHNVNDMVLDQGVCGSPLCHVSVTHWCGISGEAVGSPPRKERCARLTGDVTAKAVELLNAHFAGTFVSEYHSPASVTECMACHGASGMMANVHMKQVCLPCHGQPHSMGVDFRPLSNEFKVSQNYPNPFNSDTSIDFTMQKADNVTIEVFNLNGQHIKTIVSQQNYGPGDYSLSWNGRDEHGQDVKAGMYIFRIRAGQGMKTINMLKM